MLNIFKRKEKQYGDLITSNWCTYPRSVYWVPVLLSKPNFTRTWLMCIHWVNTKRKTHILLNAWCKNRTEDKLKKVLMHEFSHLIYHKVLKTSIYEKINKDDMKLSFLEYWDYLSNNIKHYITDYASTNVAEDFAELIGYSHYIENNINLPSKARWNNDIKFKYIIAMNFYKHWLKKFLK